MQMTVLGVDKCYFYIWTPTDTKLEIINFDEKWLEWYKPLALEFMSYIEQDIEPKRWTKKPIFIKE